MKHIRSVAFDANGVLYYRDTEVVDTVIEAARSLGLDLGDDAREEYVNLMKQAFAGAFSRAEMVERILDAWQVHDPEQRRKIADSIAAASRVIRLYPGVMPTLARLRELGIGTGVITNTFQSADEKWKWFRLHGIAPYLQRMISSIEVGVAKPDPAIFSLYASLEGLEPGEIAFVGHDRQELEGARAAGLVPLAFRPDEPGSVLPEFTDFPELLTLLGLGGKAL